MTYHLAPERENEFVRSLHASLELIDTMITETGGRWGTSNGTNAYLLSVHESIQGVYLEAVAYLGLSSEHQRLEDLQRDGLFTPTSEPDDSVSRWPLGDSQDSARGGDDDE